MPLFCLKIAYPMLYVFQPVTFLTDAAEFPVRERGEFRGIR